MRFLSIVLLLFCLFQQIPYAKDNNNIFTNNSLLEDNEELIDETILYLSDGSYTKNNYEYDHHGNLLTALTKKRQNDTWVDSKRTTYTYNNNDKELTKLDEEFKNEVWQPVKRSTNKYDVNGFLAENLNESFNNSLWVNQYRYTYVNSEKGDLLSFKIETWQSNNWQLTRLQEHNYNDGKQQYYIDESWDMGHLTSKTRSNFEYDSKGNMIKESLDLYQDDNWLETYRANHYYDSDGNDTLYVSENLQDDLWSFTEKRASKYDSKRNMLSEMDEWFDGYKWVYTAKYDYTFSENNHELTFVTQKYDTLEGVWVNRYRRTSTENEIGEISSITSENWISDKWTNNNNMLVIVDKLSKMFTFVGYKVEASYKLVNDVDESLSQNSELSCFPNPAGDHIEITLKPSEGFEPSEGSEIQIYNTLGEKVTTPSLRCNDTPPKEGNYRINISTLPRGVYFVRAGGATTKFVKK